MATQQEVQDCLQALYDDLSLAYWAASTIETKDRVYGTEELVFSLLSNLEQQTLSTNSAKYREIADQAKPVMTKLKSLKSDIDSLIHSVAVATQVANALDKVIVIAAPFFAL